MPFSMFLRRSLIGAAVLSFAITSTVIADPQIYLTDSIGRHISRYQPDGTGREEIVQSFFLPNYFAVDDANQKIYWAGASRIVRVNFDGTGLEVLYDSTDGVKNAAGVAIDPAGGFLYWAQYDTKEIYKANIDGSGGVTVLFDVSNGINNPVGIAVDAGTQKIYWTDSVLGKIFRGNADGTGVPEELFHPANDPVDIKIDPPSGMMYWTANLAMVVQRANMNGTGMVETLFNAGDGVLSTAGISIDPDENKVYWMQGGGEIYRGNSDGSGMIEKLYDILADNINAQGVAASPATKKLFYSGDASIYVGSLDGTATQATLLDFSLTPRLPGRFALHLANNKMYFLDESFSSSAIWRGNLDFGNFTAGRMVIVTSLERLFTSTDDGLSLLSDIAVDPGGNYIYWTEEISSKIMRGMLDGSGTPEELFGPGDVQNPVGLTIDTGAKKLYWTEKTSSKIRSGAIDGTGVPADLFTGADGVVTPVAIEADLDNGFLYWGDRLTKQIARGNLDGSGSPVEIFGAGDGVSEPNDIAIDHQNQKIYWADSIAIYRGSLDGSGASEKAIDDIFEGQGIVLTPDADGDGVPDEIDGCSADVSKTAPGACGCGVADTDSNGNDIADCLLNLDMQQRLSALTDLIRSLKPTNTPNKKKNKKRKKAQKQTVLEIIALANEVQSTVAANKAGYSLVDPEADLDKLTRLARKGALKAKKTSAASFKRLRKKGLKAIGRLASALTAS